MTEQRSQDPIPRGAVAFVLHAHLPWLREGGDAITLEERWFFEALWESYLPLIGVLRRLEALKPSAPVLTFSVSPTLIAMLRDPSLAERLDRYAEELRDGFARVVADRPDLEVAVGSHQERLAAAHALFIKLGGDVVKELARLAEANVIELATTSATHAFLPGLRTAESVRGQIRMGMRYFQATTKRLASTFWLPECGFDERFAPLLTDSGAQGTVLAAHGVELARPRPPHGTLQPIVGQGPFAYFGRCKDLVDLVWSPERGYPANEDYREFHERMGHHETLKPYRVGQSGDARLPYDPQAAARRIEKDARHFVDTVTGMLAAAEPEEPLLVAAFDAELFGHWWWEGPAFLEAVLTELAQRSGAVSLGAYLERDPLLPLSEPATSTWGRGGYADVWTHPASSHAARLVHRAERRVLIIDAVVRDTPRTQTQRLARLWAIRELFLLQASDYAFMLRSGEFAEFAQKKLQEHASAIDALTQIAEREVEEPADRSFVEAWIKRRPLFLDLEEDAWADAFDPW